MPGKIENQYTTLGLSKMNLRLYIICIAAVLALAGPALANSTSTVHGTVYRWDTFEPLDNAVVEVNSTPSQSMVAKYGVYSFDLAPGDYNITANYYENSSVKYSANETIKVKDQGKYLLDLLLLPVYSAELMDSSEISRFSEDYNGTVESSSSNTTNSLTGTSTGSLTGNDNSSSMNLADQIRTGHINANYLLIATPLLLILLLAGYQFSRKDKKIKEIQPQTRVYMSGKGHTNGVPSKPVKAPHLSEEVNDKMVKVPDESVKVPTESIETKLNQEHQIQESRAELSETASVIEPSDLAKESGRKLEKESLTGSVIEPVNEQIKAPVKEFALESPEDKLQAEPAEIEAEIKGGSPESGRELAESDLQNEDQEVFFEEAADKLIESSRAENNVSRKKLPLPADLQEVMDIIRGQGGRITQKDLRSKLKYSEGKVSLMLADLERRELIEKFKRGRGNVVILRDEER